MSWLWHNHLKGTVTKREKFTSKPNDSFGARNLEVKLFKVCTVFFFFSSHGCRSASTTPSGSPRSSQQSVYQSGEASGPSAGASASWNPFGDDNFSKLTAEELLNKDFAKLDGKNNVFI